MTQLRISRLLWGAAFVCWTTSCASNHSLKLWRDGVVAERQGAFSRALVSYEAALKEDPALTGAALARLRLLARRPRGAVEVDGDLAQLQRRVPRDARVSLFASAWWLRTSRPTQARHELLQGPLAWLELSKPSAGPAPPPMCPETERVWWTLRIQLALAQSQWREAQRVIFKARRRCKQLRGALYGPRARVMLALGRAVAARRLLGRRRSAGGASRRALHAEIAFVLGEGGRLDRLLRGRKDPRAAILRAWVAWQAGDPSRALRRAGRVEQLVSPLSAEVMAASLLDLDQPDLALQVLDRHVSAQPRRSYAVFFNLGVAALRVGDRNLARIAFKRAQSECPRCPEVTHNLRELARLTAER